MTIFYAGLLFFLHAKMGKKNPLKGGKGGGEPGAGRGGGGGGKQKGQKIWEGIRVAILFGAVLLLLATSLAWLGFTSIGGVVSGLLLWAFNLICSLFGAPGTALATLLLIIAVATFVIDTAADRVVNKPAKNALVAIPILALISVGPVALVMQDVNSAVRAGAADSVSWMWGA